MSSERSEARRKLRECAGLVDSLMYIVQSQINRKDVDNKVRFRLFFFIELRCILRYLSFTLCHNIIIIYIFYIYSNPVTGLGAAGGELHVSAEEPVLPGPP